MLTLATYVLFFQIPTDPARFVDRNPRASEQQLAEAREKLGLDDPFLVPRLQVVDPRIRGA